MKFKKQQPCKDEFISIRELRSRNRLKSNYYKDDNETRPLLIESNPFTPIISRCEKLKSYLIDITEYFMRDTAEAYQEPDHYSKSNFENRNLMLVCDTEIEFQYQMIQFSRLQNVSALNRIFNTLLDKLEQVLKNIQIGFIMDAETLEFNQDACNVHTDHQIPQIKEILMVEEVSKAKTLTRKILGNKMRRSIHHFFIHIQQISTGKSKFLNQTLCAVSKISKKRIKAYLKPFQLYLLSP